MKKLIIIICVLIFFVIGAFIIKYGILTKEDESDISTEELTETIENKYDMTQELLEDLNLTETTTEVESQENSDILIGNDPEEYDENNDMPIIDYSQDSNGYWDSIEIEDFPCVYEANVKEVLRGILTGYVKDCPFCTNAFKLCYSTGFLPNVTNIIFLDGSLDMANKTGYANVQVESDGNLVNYKVSYLLDDGLIDDIVLEKN